MKRFLIIFLLLTSIASPAQAETTYERVIRTGEMKCGYFTWPPFLVKDPNTGEVSGLSAEYVEKMAEILELKVNWVEETGVGDYIAGLNANRFDVMCMTLWPDAGRLKNSLLSKPIFYSGVYAAVRQDDNRFDNGFDAMNSADVIVSVIDGDITQTIAETRFPQANTLQHPQISDLSAHYQAIMTEKADVSFMDLGSFDDFDKTNPGKLKILKDLGPVQVFPEMLAVKKGEWELKMLLDNVIDLMDSDGYVYKALKSSTSSSYPSLIPYDLQEATR